MVSIIVAMTSKRVIGKDNLIPWHLPKESELFKKITVGHTIIMGRKTFQTIGKPLPFRNNIIMSKTISSIEGAEVSRTIPEALQKAEKHGKGIFIIGGESIYAQTLSLAEKLYISWIQDNYKGNKYFPSFNLDNWEVKEIRTFRDFTFKLYERNNLRTI